MRGSMAARPGGGDSQPDGQPMLDLLDGLQVDNRHPETIAEVPVTDLPRSFNLRLGANDPRHARLLAQNFENLPPIVLHRQTMAVIDGNHRLLAATLSGHSRVPVRFFDGSEAEAFVEAVRLNTTHGKPLSLAERENAADKLLTLWPEWSDRRLAEICGLSPKTVGAIRARSNLPAPFGGRVGRDGRIRPGDPASRRMEIARLIHHHPDASNRSLAAQVGTSQATVIDVRRRLQSGENPVPQRFITRAGPVPDSEWAPEVKWEGGDAACCSTDEGRTFTDWFDGNDVDEGTVRRYVESVPLSRVYVVADEARRRASIWQLFASLVEGRTRRRAGN
jgi:hypothetical protein